MMIIISIKIMIFMIISIVNILFITMMMMMIRRGSRAKQEFQQALQDGVLSRFHQDHHDH